MTLSKSQYIRGLQCPKSLWLYKNKPELLSKKDEAVLQSGINVGDFTKRLFPGGYEVEFNPQDFKGMIQKTKELLKEVNIIYEAAFSKNNIFVMADILVKNGDKWDIYEVKSSTSVKNYHLDDAAIQYYAIKDVIPVNKVYIIHIDNTYERNGELEIDKLFKIVDITEKVLEKQKEIPIKLKELEKVLNGDEPNIDIGPHCFEPFECDFYHYCWKDIPEFSVFNLYRMNSKNKFDLYYKGIVSFDEIDESSLNKTQQIQVKTYKEKSIYIEKDIIKEFLDKLVYPLNYLDFETFQEAIPRFNHQRPYEQIPFQYSLHIDYGNNLIHKEFLADECEDPREKLIISLLKDLEKEGSIIAYNMSFEKRVISNLAQKFPKYEKDLNNLIERFVDLIEPFRNLGVYHYNFNGSFSIKSVLPALFDDDNLNYKNLGLIQNGGDAMDAFVNLCYEKDENLKAQIKKDLLKYCELDTFAMVKLVEKLKEFL